MESVDQELIWSVAKNVKKLKTFLREVLDVWVMIT